jgi:hypothetical protein
MRLKFLFRAGVAEQSRVKNAHLTTIWQHYPQRSGSVWKSTTVPSLLTSTQRCALALLKMKFSNNSLTQLPDLVSWVAKKMSFVFPIYFRGLRILFLEYIEAPFYKVDLPIVILESTP